MVKIRLQSLQYFEKLIELKNYSSVANFFNVYQSTISMGIKRLENEAGCQLVIHNLKHNELILTSAGKAFHKYSKIIVDQLPLLNNEIKKYHQQMNFNLGISSIINTTYFPKIAANLNEKILLNLNIVNEDSKVLIKMLKKEELNFAVIATMSPIKLKGFKSEILTKDHFELVASKQNYLANKTKINLKDLNLAKFIQMNGESNQSIIFDEIKKHSNHNLDIVYRTRNYELIEKLIKKDVGISFLLSKSINFKDDIVPINFVETPEVFISLVCRNDYKLNEDNKKLIEVILKSF